VLKSAKGTAMKALSRAQYEEYAVLPTAEERFKFVNAL
jgi:hypothetical protein